MNIKSTPFRLCSVAAVLVALSGAVWAEEQQYEENTVETAKWDAIGAIEADRESAIAVLVSQWSASASALGYPLDEWTVEFGAMLEGASAAKLYDIGNATDYDGVRAILQGRSTPVSTEGLVGTDDLGDLTQDLVFTPVTPCRIVDTRYDSDGAIRPALNSNIPYYVYGSAALLAPQGHNFGVASGAGCPSPRGEPSAVAINATVAQPLGNGNVRAFPFGAATPTVSLLNYQIGANIANAGIVASCYGCTRDMSVRAEVNSTHWIVDVMGFFYPVNPQEVVTASGTTDGFGTLVSGSNYLISSAPVAPSKNATCLVQTQLQINTDTTDAQQFTYVRTARKIGVGAPADDSMYGQYTPAVGRSWSPSTTASYVYTVAAGTSQTFGCYVSAGGDLVGNGYHCRTSVMCH